MDLPRPFRDEQVASRERAAALEAECRLLEAKGVEADRALREVSRRAAPAAVRALRSRRVWVAVAIAMAVGYGAASYARAHSTPSACGVLE